MSDNTNNLPVKKPVGIGLVFLIIIIAILLAGSWILTKGVGESNTAEQAPQSTPKEPANQYGTGTGGSSGVGTGAPNDPNTGSDSPAGGTDTNQVPSGGYTPRQ